MKMEVEIFDERIIKLLEYSDKTILPMTTEQVIREAIDYYFRRREIKARYIAALLQKDKTLDEEALIAFFPGDDRVTRQAIKEARRLINHLKHL